MARASDSARWLGTVGEPNSGASVPSLQLGASSRVTTPRASLTVSTAEKPGQARPVAAAAALRKPTSNGALWATSTEPAANSRNAGRADSIRGAADTIESVMPVMTWMKAGIGLPGFTNVWNSPSRRPPRTLTAPISVMPSAGVPPVVSRSTTTKVTSRSGVPSSENVPWTPRSCPGREAGSSGATVMSWDGRCAH